ncbi:hypothetical protein PV325_003291 [Microctonus aethiopoides]|uniref:N-acetyltransferase domain-containing protein n=1 Tax=Microctonus aethiopoides TaxID=144406 RepID=A0AA39C6U5_9HYME|nr:hypothetical protein PV325_003291 [Microctonus aethiopoides]KAK0091584.1 hypothetical protein PV326_002993 [Microctonus aethiopoides]KAK0158994.1 hypothetical protein PV328_009927 [Microctonus aethiopoides]
MADEVKIRETERRDCKELNRLIHELAKFEEMPDGPKLNAEILERDGFGENPLFYGYVAEINNQIIGYAIYYYTYSTWCGKSMFLNDIFVLPAFRIKGIGGLLFDAIVKKAADVKCGRLDFSVLEWNPAANFYKHRGVTDITETEKWHQYRMEFDAIEKYVQNKK